MLRNSNLRNFNLLTTIKHVKNDSPSLKVYMQKTKCQKESRTSRRTKIRFKSKSTKDD
jgi:hypothetical protein